jgi:hypothetical protein
MQAIRTKLSWKLFDTSLATYTNESNGIAINLMTRRPLFNLVRLMYDGMLILHLLLDQWHFKN